MNENVNENEKVMKKKYLKPEALVEAMELEQCVMLVTSDTAADDSEALSRDIEDMAQQVIFIDMLE